MPKLSHFVLGWVAEQVTGIGVLSAETRFIKEKRRRMPKSRRDTKGGID